MNDRDQYRGSDPALLCDELDKLTTKLLLRSCEIERKWGVKPEGWEFSRFEVIGIVFDGHGIAHRSYFTWGEINDIINDEI